jgi:hypothetical protein
MSDKDRALDIIGASLYADPMMDEVQDIRKILKSMPPVYSSVLIGVAAGVPIEIYREYFSWRIAGILKEASADFVSRFDTAYGITHGDTGE